MGERDKDKKSTV